MRNMNVAVIGAGIMGASTARVLAKRGHPVTIFDPFEPGHAMGSSHGRSRIVRRAYPDAFYTEIMQEGYPMWAELQAEAGETILHECGLLYFGSGDSPDIVSVQAGLRANAVPFETLESADVHGVFPGLRLQSGEVGIWTPEAGWVHAERAVRASLRIAQSFGAVWNGSRVESVADLEETFDAVVLTPGGWITKFLALDVEVQARTFAYIEAQQSGPVWIDDGPGLHYGFPCEPEGETIKIGGHIRGETFDPERPDRPVDPANVEAIRDLALRRFGIENPVVRESAMCLYTRTPDEDFRIGRLSDRTVYASACSGHGFKFGPWVGKYLADLVEGERDERDFPRFAVRPTKA